MGTGTYIAGALLALLLAGCGGGGGGTGGLGIAGGVPGSAGAQADSSKPGDGTTLQALADTAPDGAMAQAVAAGRDQSRPSADRAGSVKEPIYYLFGSDGARYTFQLLLQTKRYRLQDAAGKEIWGDFKADPDDPTGYVFVTPADRANAGIARFRATNDLVVGSYPLAVPFANPVRHTLQPFIAVRNLTRNTLYESGFYNRVTTSVTAAGVRTSVWETVKTYFAGGGASVCGATYAHAQCPESLIRSEMPFTTSSGASGDDAVVAWVNGERVYLRAFRSTDGPQPTATLQIGLLETVFWPSSTARGATTAGAYGTASISDAALSTMLRDVGGSTANQQLTLSSLDLVSATGLRAAQGTSASERYYLMKNSRLAVMAGRSTPGQAATGQLFIGLIDPTPPTVAPGPLTLKVRVNGIVVSPSETDTFSSTYKVDPADRIEVESNADMTLGMFADGDTSGWNLDSPSPEVTIGAFEATLRTASLLLSNRTTAPLRVNLAGGSSGIGARFLYFDIAGGDARNGDYRVYTPWIGDDVRLSLDFNLHHYIWDEATGPRPRLQYTGRFAKDPIEAGTYLLQGVRHPDPVGVARFRLKNGAVVGALPFRPFLGQPQPFLAVSEQSFLTTPAQLDGTYNLFGFARGYNGDEVHSEVTRVRIFNAGTQLQFCRIVLQSGGCIAGEGADTYNISPTHLGFRLDRVQPEALLGTEFRMARLGSQNVLLPDRFGTRVGLQDSPEWPAVTARGASTFGDHGTASVGPSTYSGNFTRSDGTPLNFSHPLTALAESQGIRGVNLAGPARYMAAQNQTLALLLGEAGNPGTEGYFRIDLVD